MSNEILNSLRRSIREAQREMKAGKTAAQKHALQMLITSRRLEFERYQRTARGPLPRAKRAPAGRTAP